MKILSYAISILLIVSLLGVNTNAATADPVSPLWDAMARVEVAVNFSGNSGVATVDVSGIHGITNQIDAILVVYEVVDGEWVYVDSTGGSASTALGLQVNFNAVSGTTYVAEAIITAYSSEGSETDSITDTSTCP